ncbi:hypothetical protein KOR42_39700 [Thalassoglobus neptunius]|uniref:Uncharacterized protein n=1 Tax=Thalassoglobus neptunius TaxID=1938619 RepID=A0A5C5WE92_9PLAN|nr:hypothetical protein [Thalassoglobus neptunius]TWT49054.1 hypothetical protein KOR42_39700 [Thalassoglobus neptunius]
MTPPKKIAINAAEDMQFEAAAVKLKQSIKADAVLVFAVQQGGAYCGTFVGDTALLPTAGNACRKYLQINPSDPAKQTQGFWERAAARSLN